MDAGALNAEGDTKVDTGPLRGWFPAVATLGIAIHTLYLGCHVPHSTRLSTPRRPARAQGGSRARGQVS